MFLQSLNVEEYVMTFNYIANIAGKNETQKHIVFYLSIYVSGAYTGGLSW